MIQVEAYLKQYGHGGPGVCLGDGQTEAYLKDMAMTGLASAWGMARRRPKAYRRKVYTLLRRMPPIFDLGLTVASHRRLTLL